ncbi:FtsH protease activity modulator HflK [Nitrincola iocasae]|uniref:Protein HflK n=1 Tax=Nitrincola iocasae TaxID=2614693 RepID=A0A5J6LGC9_9GAMM|nr:FtsH protease activity modulator HflK [Nitrincola iocasae]QEW07627.1 FtsH protease activity modulator HflK [Nitrincola iocasae]
MAWNEPGGNGKNHDPWSSGGDKNPGGGKRNGGGNNDQGPPDLDEALQKLQDRLNGLFGSKKDGSGNSGGTGSSGGGKGGSFTLVGIVAVLALVVWAGMGFYTVDQQERGVVLRLGKFHNVVNPGLQWNPPLIDEVNKVNVTQVRIHDHRALMLTEDENIVDVDISVQYVAENPEFFTLKVRNPEVSLAQASEAALRQVVGGSDMNSILTEGRQIMAISVQERLQRHMDNYETGIRISGVNVRNAQAPSQVQDAFDDVIKAREDEQRSKNEAEAYANSVVPEARGNAQRMFEEASAYREEVVARANGESQRFLALLTEYRQAPDVTRERLYIDMMQNVLTNTPKVLMDVESGSNNVMFLPLDKLMEQQRGTSGASTRSSSAEMNLRQLNDQVTEQARNRQAGSLREGR